MASASPRRQLEESLARNLLRLPLPALRVALGRRDRKDGRVLDEQVQWMLRLERLARRPRTEALSIDDARADLDANARVFAPHAPTMERTLQILAPGPAGGIPVRVYRPFGLSPVEPSPALLYFHGGGFCAGSLDSHDAVARVLAKRGACQVYSVDYRLAPEHPFPAAPDDCLAAFRYLVAEARSLGIDPARIAVGGDSAGGNLAAVLAQDTRADAVRPCLQLLVYPAVDFTMSFPSTESVGRGYFLERSTLIWFRERYLPGATDAELREPRVSPLYGDLRGLPPALVQTAGFDPLRDEGDAYAVALRAAGNQVTHRSYASLIHGYWNIAGSILAARPPMDDAVAALRRAFE